MKHRIEIAGLVLLTILVILAVVYTQKPSLQAPLADTATEVTPTAEVEFSAQESTLPPETTTEWLPEIQYDDYAPSTIEQTNFHNTVIIGNSQAQALGNFGLVKNADFVTKVGLSINHVLSDPNGTAPIQRLQGKSYRKAVFVFGENELGWPYPSNFVKIYKQVIARVRAMNPGVEVYIQGVFPVTKEVSEKSKSGITNENVRKFNAALEDMCEEIDATFMPVSDAFRDETGALPEGVAHDGIHFGYDLCKVWAGDMSAYIGDASAETTEETETVPPTVEDVLADDAVSGEEENV